MIDGPRLVIEALAAGMAIDEVYVPVDALSEGTLTPMLDALRAAKVPVVALAAEVFTNVAPTNAPQPALAVAAPPAATRLADVVAFDAVLVLVDLADPGNAGTLVRVAEASGIGAVIACGSTVEWWNPKVVRASAGSLFRVPVCSVDEPLDVVGALHDAGHLTAATTLEHARPYTELDCTGPVAFVLGSESHGLRDDVAAACTMRVHIPMAGGVESLNVAMAGAVCAFELARQRRRSS